MSVMGTMIFGLIPIILLILILGAIFSARSRKNGMESTSEGQGGKSMIKTVYTYLILFATLMMTIGGSVASFMAVADLVSPSGYYMSYEEFKRGWNVPKEAIDPIQSKIPAEQIKSEEQWRKEYQLFENQEKARTRERALNSLIKSFGWIVIPLPVFLYYQRRLKNDKEL